jgi:hypothetical protein
MNTDPCHESDTVVAVSVQPLSAILSHQGASANPEFVCKLCKMLRGFKGWLDEYPPLQQPMRFGNQAPISPCVLPAPHVPQGRAGLNLTLEIGSQAFRQWHERLKTDLPKLLVPLLPEVRINAVDSTHVSI